MARKIAKLVGMLSMAFGVFILGYYMFPFVNYEIQARTEFYQHVSPVPEGSREADNYQGGAIDYTRASNWFAASPTDFGYPKVGFYTVTIEKLGIADMAVAIGGEDLSESLVQYAGEVLPGGNGKFTVFGHSILPRFYDPTDPLAVFSTLHQLSDGDEILVKYDGVAYKYVVEDMFEVKPEDTYILDQDASGPTVQLVTCTPPGHPLRPRRLVVKAKLVPHDSGSI